MPLLDVSKVTTTLTNLLSYRIEEMVAASDDLPAWLEDVTVVSRPPDMLSGENLIGLYLYHLSEDAAYKNCPAPGADPAPIKYTPMGLNLYYQLVAHSKENGDPTSDTAVLREQCMMGLAVKALRDFPVVDAGTEISERKVFPPALQDKEDRFRIVLQPIPHNDAVTFWTAGSSPLRLSSYYQVSVVLLEPEKSKSRTGRVLRYGAYAFIGGAPRLDGSSNTLFYRVPLDTAPRALELRPAQVPYVSGSPEVINGKKNGDIALSGSGLSGDRTSLLLKHSRWKQAAEADSSWAVSLSDQGIQATIQPTIATAGGPLDVLPGVYAALARVTTRRTMSDGTVRVFEHLSNEAPFLITPRIDAIADPYPPDVAGVVEVEGWIFQYTDPEDSAFELDVRVCLGGAELERTDSATPGPGTFTVAGADTLRFVRPLGLTATSALPLRIFVNGAESPPQWIAMPAS